MSNGRRSTAVPWVVALAAALIAVVAFVAPRLSGGGEQRPAAAPVEVHSSSQAPDQYAALAALARRQGGDPTARGSVDAPVVMVAYSDFQCPFCGKFARDTEPALVRKYVEPGILRIEWRDFPYLGTESKLAAHAARAAALQNRFWDYHDALYAHQFPPNSGHLTTGYLTRLASRVGLDVPRFRKDMAGRLVDKLVRRDFDEGLTAGVTGTPLFLVNGRPVIGAQPLAEFERVIDQAAKHADGKVDAG